LLQNFRGQRYKTAIEIDHSKESLQLLDISWPWMGLDRHHSIWKWPNTLGSDMMAKDMDFRYCKLALPLVDDQASCWKAKENILHILLVLLHGLAGHDDFIQVDGDEGKSS
jgi:hypothetical protein